LAVHAADHVKGRLGFAAQGQFQEVVLNARFEGLAQLALDLEEPIGGAQIREAMKEADAELVLQRAREKYPQGRPQIISDNGPQFVAKDYKEFLRLWQMTHVMCAGVGPRYVTQREGISWFTLLVLILQSQVGLFFGCKAFPVASSSRTCPEPTATFCVVNSTTWHIAVMIANSFSSLIRTAIAIVRSFGKACSDSPSKSLAIA